MNCFYDDGGMVCKYLFNSLFVIRILLEFSEWASASFQDRIYVSVIELEGIKFCD